VPLHLHPGQEEHLLTKLPEKAYLHHLPPSHITQEEADHLSLTIRLHHTIPEEAYHHTHTTGQDRLAIPEGADLLLYQHTANPDHLAVQEETDLHHLYQHTTRLQHHTLQEGADLHHLHQVHITQELCQNLPHTIHLYTGRHIVQEGAYLYPLHQHIADTNHLIVQEGTYLHHLHRHTTGQDHHVDQEEAFLVPLCLTVGLDHLVIQEASLHPLHQGRGPNHPAIQEETPVLHLQEIEDEHTQEEVLLSHPELVIMKGKAGLQLDMPWEAPETLVLHPVHHRHHVLL